MNEADSWFRLIAAVIERARRDLGVLDADEDNWYARKAQAEILRDGGHPREFLDDLERFDTRVNE